MDPNDRPPNEEGSGSAGRTCPPLCQCCGARLERLTETIDARLVRMNAKLNAIMRHQLHLERLLQAVIGKVVDDPAQLAEIVAATATMRADTETMKAAQDAATP